MKTTISALFLIACLLPVSATAGKTVTAKGFSFFEPGREMVAREKALDEAKRTAIETAFGTVIESRTAVENFEVVKDQIFSRASGYLSNVQILDETKTDLGTYEVSIQADVEVSVLVDDLDRFREMIQWQHNPRLSIVLEQGLAADHIPSARKAANLLTEKLQANGFKVFRKDAGGDLQMGFQVALGLELASRTSTYQGLELTLNEVGLTANIYRPGDGRVLGASSAVRSIPGENRLQILDQGARDCVGQIWNDLRDKLLRLWEKELYSDRELFLVVTALPDIARAQELAPIFTSDVAGVLEAKLISFTPDVGEFSVRYRGWPEQFFNELQMGYFRSRYFDSKLESLAGNKLVIQLVEPNGH